MLGLTPPCTMFSQLMQMWNLKHLTVSEKDCRMSEAVALLDFAIKAARLQHSLGRYFFLEQPSGAVSWHHLKKRLKAEPMQPSDRATFIVTFDQCRYGLVSPCGKPMRKKTKFWSNCPTILQEFQDKRCRCTMPHEVIQGTQAGHRLSVWAQHFPAELCASIARCIMDA